MHCTLMIHSISAFETVDIIFKILKTIQEKLLLKMLMLQTELFVFLIFILTYKVNEPLTVNKQIMIISA